MALSPDATSLIGLTVDYQKSPSEKTVREIISILARRDDPLQTARWLAKQNDVSTYAPEFLLSLHAKFPQPHLALGGGADFLYPLWRNLDPNMGPLNSFGFEFTANDPLPVKSRSCDLVYIHNAIDGGDDATSRQIVRESARAVREGGVVLLTSRRVSTETLSAFVAEAGLSFMSSDKEKILPRFNYVPRLGVDSASRNYVVATTEG